MASAMKGVPPGGVIFVVDDQWRPVCGVPFDGDAERKEHDEKMGASPGGGRPNVQL